MPKIYILFSEEHNIPETEFFIYIWVDKLIHPTGALEAIPIRHIQSTKSEPFLTESFSIRDISELLGSEDMIQDLHRHDFYYILALKSAVGHHTIDFTAYPVGDNSIYFMRPGQVHDLLLKSRSSGFLIQFSDSFYLSKDRGAYQSLRRASSRNHYELNVEAFERLQIILNYIAQEYNDQGAQFEDVIRANLSVFFIELSRHQASTSTTGTTLYIQDKLENFLELVEANIFQQKQVAQYAEMLNLTPYQLNSITKNALGKTSSEVINQHVILEAKRCLLATSNQVNQTAYRLGYDDVSYFIRFFKKQTGYSPEAFRNNFR